MIYFSYFGGFGNQLFQISTAIALSIENNDIAVFPPWQFNKYFKNQINTDEPKNFDIKLKYEEPEFRYIKIPYTNGIDLHGYFQSEKYFKNYEKEIRETFTLKDEIEIKIKNNWGDILKTNTVSIHIRRGDYLQKQDFHPCPNINYYENSLDYIKKYHKINNILIFSDDIQWCKEKFIGDYIFVENQNEIEDMFLMSYCDDNIIANSSFSWWGSWLNKNPNKIVCAPSIWFGKNGYNNWLDIYYEKMIVINE